MEFDEKWLKAHYAKMGMLVPEEIQRTLDAANGRKGEAEKPEEKRRKYGNHETVVDGIRFDSVHEASVYGELKLRRQAGDILGLFLQVPFQLPGGTKYVADFVTLKRDGTFDVLDAKSEATSRDKVYRMKKRMMRECLGITIIEV